MSEGWRESKEGGERKELWKKQRRNEGGLSHPLLAFFPSLRLPIWNRPVRSLPPLLARSLSSGLASDRPAGLCSRSLAGLIWRLLHIEDAA